tara:strand:- start:992 stop:1165 length:174 start_codon:yes stop_codon:yes gene_type:complete
MMGRMLETSCLKGLKLLALYVIHLTDSMLGTPRVSPFETAREIRKSNKLISIFCVTI